MSYCRWSSMDMQCDLYVFDHCGGGTAVYVAGRRRVVQSGKALPPQIGDWWERGEEGIKEYMAREKQVAEAYGMHEDPFDPSNEAPGKWHYLPAPHAGATYIVPTHEEAAQLVEQLIALGFKCPDGLVETLRTTPDCLPEKVNER